MNLVEHLEVIERWLDSVGVQSDDLPEPVDTLLWEQIGKFFHRQLPSDLSLLYARHDGFPDWLYFFQTWLIVPATEILAATQMLRVAFMPDNSPEAWRPDWLPFAADGAGNYLFLDLPTSTINKFTHEGGYCEFLFNDLDAFLGQIASDINEQLYSFQDYEVNYYGSVEL
ncbi:SMI1/KNR4 family protein [Deinococcus aquatilis]|uniref:SMI1/KNR4 family protein n=1 Tax=Deinococcus aquatilis TaxID=519440 RepID=UPI000364A9F0|nr:SMI1/KNR4 family protein [Deinococcus aquatilis]